MPNYPVISFNAGELSPQIDARSDVNKYRFGCRTMENMIPRIYGPAERRPGTKFIDEVNGPARIQGFIYSTSIAYMLLFEHKKLYFYYNGGQVLDGGGSRLVIATPYDSADLAGLQFKQLNDVMWITHPDYPQYKLSRTSATAFSLAAITFDFGPFKKRNDLAVDDGITLKPSVITGTGTLTASLPMFEESHVGALFSVVQPRVDTIRTGIKVAPSSGIFGLSILVEGTFSFTTHGTWTGTVRLDRSIDNSTWETYRTWTGSDDRNVQFTATEEERNIFYRIRMLSLTSGKIEVDLTVNSSTQQGICRITGYTSSTVVSMTVLKNFASIDADVRWLEGSWSKLRGYPTCMTFFEDRAVYAGSPHQPQTIWLSSTGDYEYFYEGTLDDASFWLSMSSDQRNAIQWITSLEALLMGTTGGLWRLRSSAFDESLTPTNFSIKQQNSNGSKAIQALPINDVILFVDPVGRKVREATYDGGKEKFVSPDLTALAEHITKSGITAIAHQKHPDSLLWAVLDDGMPVSMAYERDQNVIAWSKHPMSG